jgi:hypothetical protein
MTNLEKSAGLFRRGHTPKIAFATITEFFTTDVVSENVLIIGEVGLTLAIELARFGIPVRIVDKAAQRTDKSKALVLWSRILELLDRQLGGSTAFMEAGFKAKPLGR